jgi:4-methylaminobutanoate oxidase (formaldehyde-forming)
VQVRLLDPQPLMHHAEIVHRNGAPLGYVRAASYGHTLEGAVGLAMIDADEPITSDYLGSGSWEIEVAGVRHPAVASLRPMYDPDNSRIRA